MSVLRWRWLQCLLVINNPRSVSHRIVNGPKCLARSNTALVGEDELMCMRSCWQRKRRWRNTLPDDVPLVSMLAALNTFTLPILAYL